MEPWQIDLLHHPLDDATSLPQAFARIEQAAHALGFEYVSYCHQAPLPASNRGSRWSTTTRKTGARTTPTPDIS